MDIFDVLALIGGLCLFLFGMNVMGESLERRAGGSLRNILAKMTSNKAAGFLTGMGVTAVIQSSSATTVMVVGFVNSGLMTLRQAINVIMGANVGTTVTAWILSLSGIEGDNLFVQLLKPTSFTPVLALIGIGMQMFSKKDKAKDTGLILLGFATLMFGMDAMSASVEGLAKLDGFKQLFVMFTNPVLGLLAGAILTAIIQSSSASVGILQALAMAGGVSYGAAIPIIMGQNIGTCVTAMISSVGTGKNARRAALVHLSFNIVGSLLLLCVFSIVRAFAVPSITEFLAQDAEAFGIAVAHSIFNIICVCVLMPMSGLLEKLAYLIIPDKKDEEDADEEAIALLDERLLATPSVALERCHQVTVLMSFYSLRGMNNAIRAFTEYTPELAKSIRKDEDLGDKYEDALGSYLIKLAHCKLSEDESDETTALLKLIGDFERISDHAVNVLESAEELREKNLTLSEDAVREFEVISSAVSNILEISAKAFEHRDAKEAMRVEPLEQVIDRLKEKMRTRHMRRMQKGECTAEIGFIWSDILTNMERTSDHCSNIAGCIIDTEHHTLHIHETLKHAKDDSTDFNALFEEYVQMYKLP